MQTIQVKIDLHLPPCEICGSISVDLTGKPVPCGFHDFCPPCGGTKQGWGDHPQYCPVHVCWKHHRNLRIGSSCDLRKGHDRDCWISTNGGLFFAQLDLIGTVIECRHTVGHDWIDGVFQWRYEWKPEIVRGIEAGWQGENAKAEGRDGPRLNGWESDLWRIPK
jgi:hypothetical protein